jgi:glucose dehydrogenase
MRFREAPGFLVLWALCAMYMGCGGRGSPAAESSSRDPASVGAAGESGANVARVGGARAAAEGGSGGVRALVNVAGRGAGGVMAPGNVAGSSVSGVGAPVNVASSGAGGVSASVSVAGSGVSAPGSVAGGAGANATTSEPTAANHPGVPPEVAQAQREWPLPGRDYNNSRYTQDSPIDSSNVSKLVEAWRVEMPGLAAQFGKISTAPLILGGVVYIEDTWSTIKAIHLADGSVKWSVDAVNPNIGPNGVAVAWGKVFAIGGSDSVVAYDAETGTQLWTKRVIDTNTTGIDIQPTVFDDLVLVSTVPTSLAGQYTGGDRGILKALDQQTGEVRWLFDTIKSDDIWGNAEVNSGGGSWFTPSIDSERGHVFWGIGNPAPFPGTTNFPNASSRVGDNLYTDSTLALDVRTGSYLWHYQTVQRDLFDRDVCHTMLTEVAGVPAVVSTGKEGRVWAHRRDTGEVLWGPVSVGVHMNDELTELTAQTSVLPGTFGGVLTPPALADGVAYVAAVNIPTMYTQDFQDFLGSQIGSMAGNLVAIDVASGKVLWDAPVDGDPTGGVTIINDLAITATFQGNVFAYQRATGKEVWRWTAPGGINSWISVAADTLVIPVGLSDPAVVVALRLSTTGGAPGSSAAGGPAAGNGAAGQTAPTPRF